MGLYVGAGVGLFVGAGVGFGVTTIGAGLGVGGSVAIGTISEALRRQMHGNVRPLGPAPQITGLDSVTKTTWLTSSTFDNSIIILHPYGALVEVEIFSMVRIIPSRSSASPS